MQRTHFPKVMVCWRHCETGGCEQAWRGCQARAGRNAPDSFAEDNTFWAVITRQGDQLTEPWLTQFARDPGIQGQASARKVSREKAASPPTTMKPLHLEVASLSAYRGTKKGINGPRRASRPRAERSYKSKVFHSEQKNNDILWNIIGERSDV